MKRKKGPKSVAFFNASALLDDLSENEMFKLKGGTSDGEYIELPEVVVVGEIPDDEEEEEEEEEDPGYDPEDGYDWDDADNDPTDEDWWDNDGGGDDYQPPESSTEEGPWQRDANGKLITTDTGRTTQVAYTNYTLQFKEVTIKTPDGTTVTAFQVTQVINNQTGQPMTSIPDNFNSNCTGFAFAGGDVWLFDSNLPGDESSSFQNLLTNSTLFDEVTNKSDADMAVIWWTDTQTGERFIAHSAEVNDDGTYDQKNEYGSVQHGVDENGFINGHTPSPGLYTMEIEYYKRNY
ncbi:hypothetical protein [Chitinophaga sp. 22620]|uniref:hypothetical protein n=1 Tax=Chitinophaga sp. 22620 TaxID=3453952 RepID=UPI003F839A19